MWRITALAGAALCLAGAYYAHDRGERRQPAPAVRPETIQPGPTTWARAPAALPGDLAALGPEEEVAEESEHLLLPGQVVDSRTGRAIAEANVAWALLPAARADSAQEEDGDLNDEALASGTLETDEQGRFEVELDAAEGDPEDAPVLRLTVERSGYTQMSRTVPSTDWLLATSPVVLALQPRGRVLGRLLDVEGQPIAGEEISYVDPEGEERSGGSETDEQGRFEIEDLDPGEHMVFAAADGTARAAVEVVHVRAGAPVTVTLLQRDLATVPLRGTVVDQTGLPVALVELVVHPSRPPRDAAERYLLRQTLHETTGLDGTFEVEVPGAGWYEVVAKDGASAGGAVLGRAQLVAGGEPGDQRVVVTRGIVRCSVTDPSGRPFAFRSYSISVSTETEGRGIGGLRGGRAPRAELSVVWPRRCERLTISVGGRGLAGSTVLTAPGDPCRLVVQPAPT